MKRFGILILFTMLCVGQAFASVRNIFGYVLGLGTNVHAIAYITVQSGTNTYYASWGYYPWLCPGGLRWWQNSLPTDRSYVVTVYSNGAGSRRVAFWLPSGSGDFKAPNIGF